MFKYILLLLFIIPVSLFAQVRINGKVADITNHKPIENASVILSNSTVGNRTDSTGTFILKNVRSGQYDLVVSIVGYEAYHMTVMVTNANLTLPLIELLPKSITLNEVVIKPDNDWVHHFEIFKAELLGDSPEAKQCKILNPDVVHLSYENGKLLGSSDEFMEIENRALGYKIKYLLHNFTKDYAKQMIYYEGSVLFEDLPTESEEQKERWKKARDKAYYGSLQHFLRAARKNECEAEGFRVFQMAKIPNPRRPTDEVIKSKYAYFNTIGGYGRAAQDSLYKWELLERLPKTVPSVVKEPVNPTTFISLTNQKGIYALTFPTDMYVMYIKTQDGSANTLTYRIPNSPNYSSSILTFTEKAAFFDDNGSVLNSALATEGAMSKSRMSGMLPIDYVPYAPPQ